MMVARGCLADLSGTIFSVNELPGLMESDLPELSDQVGNPNHRKSGPEKSRERSRMTAQNQSSDETYLVVVNDEEQYSIWRDDKSVPAGWRATGRRGPKAECLQYIEDVWTDMRPLSLRKRMADAAARDVS
jgi:MbtH protein